MVGKRSGPMAKHLITARKVHGGLILFAQGNISLALIVVFQNDFSCLCNIKEGETFLESDP